ncbi:MAG: ABC transporter permease [Terriglobales bacterium]
MRMLHSAWRLALVDVRLAARTPAAMFFSFLFPLIFLFAYGAIFAQGSPRMVAYLFGPVVVLQILSSTFFGLGIRVVALREQGALRRYRLAPVGAGAMVCGNLIANYLLLIPTVILLLICARLFFHMPLTMHGWDFAAIVTVGDFALAGFGLMIGAVAETMQEAQVFSNAAFFPLLFLSGATIPLAELPHWLQRVAAFLPSTYLVAGMQQAMIQGGRGALQPAQLLALVLAGIFGLTLSAQLFRWDKEERLPARRKLFAAAFAVPFLLMGAWMNARPATLAAWGRTLQAASGSSAAASPSASSAPSSAAKAAAKVAPAAAAGAPTLVSAFDDPGRPATSSFGAGWDAATDALLGGSSQAALRVVAGGAPGSRGSLLVTGTVTGGTRQPWAGAVFYPGPGPWAPGDLSRWRTLTFWARGGAQTNTYALVLLTAERRTNPPVQTFIAGPRWRQVSISLAALSARREQVLGVIFAATEPGPFRLQLDQVRLR